MAAAFCCLAGGYLSIGGSEINRNYILRPQYTHGVLKSCHEMAAKKSRY